MFVLWFLVDREHKALFSSKGRDRDAVRDIGPDDHGVRLGDLRAMGRQPG
jgi:hypothetical protein